ncbi:hypothetical protein EDC04DRAFT_2663645 [Pisolithus marmoratus]|nr:hypothetical protein EDC04DRAFT_2663645 [Pisolithus marmoratus]
MPPNMHDPEAPDQPPGDCSICMEVTHVNNSKQSQQVTGGLLHKVGVKKLYSVAPCRRTFVSAMPVLNTPTAHEMS